MIGSDVKLNSPSSLIGQALAEILQYPDKARDALRVLLHLVRNAEHVYHEIDTHEVLKYRKSLFKPQCDMKSPDI